MSNQETRSNGNRASLSPDGSAAHRPDNGAQPAEFAFHSESPLTAAPSPETVTAQEEGSQSHPAPQSDIAVNVLVALVSLAGLGLVGLGAWHWETESLAALLVLAVLAIAAERLDLSLYGDSRVSVSFVPIFSAVLLAGFWGLALVVPLMVLASELGRARPLHKIMFNLGTLMVAGAGSAFVFHFSGHAGSPESWPDVLAPSVVAATLNYGINSALVALAVGLSSQTSPWEVWNEKFRWLWPHYLVLGLLGLAIASAYELMGLWGIAVFLAPPVMMRYSFKQYLDRTDKNVRELRQANEGLREAHRRVMEGMESLRNAYDDTLRSLIAALDARDRETRGHSERVAELALAIAHEMGISPESQDWQELRWAALLHDVGKIGVPDAILRKKGELSDAEWQAMRTHPGAGYEILRGVDFLGGGSEIVHAHHERFDGRGYPRGLAGADIPLGARIFSVADAFDAMTSDRPYRKAMAGPDALAEILRHSGTQFDPEAVRAFLGVYQKQFAPRRRSPLAAKHRALASDESSWISKVSANV